jgi:hypothetical protein
MGSMRAQLVEVLGRSPAIVIVLWHQDICRSLAAQRAQVFWYDSPAESRMIGPLKNVAAHFRRIMVVMSEVIMGMGSKTRKCRVP